MSDFDFSELRMPLASSEIHKSAEEGDIDFSELGQPPAEKLAPAPTPEAKEEPKEVTPEEKKPEEKPKDEEAPKVTGLPTAKELDANAARFFDIAYAEDYLGQLQRAKESAGVRIYGGTITFRPLMKMPQHWTIELTSPSAAGKEIIGAIKPEGIDTAVAEANEQYEGKLDTVKISNSLAKAIVQTLVLDKMKSGGFRFRSVSFRGLDVALPKPEKKKPGEPKEKTYAPQSFEDRLLIFFDSIGKTEYKRLFPDFPFMMVELAKDKYKPIEDIVAKHSSGAVSVFKYHLKKDGETLIVENGTLTAEERMKDARAKKFTSLLTAEDKPAQPAQQWAGPVLDQIGSLVGAPAASWASELAGALAAKFNYEWPTFPPLGLKRSNGGL